MSKTRPRVIARSRLRASPKRGHLFSPSSGRRTERSVIVGPTAIIAFDQKWEIKTPSDPQIFWAAIPSLAPHVDHYRSRLDAYRSVGWKRLDRKRVPCT